MTVTAARQADGRWQCCVTDNGIGIPPEFADKIFVIFQRLHGRDAYPGTGIGLALCKRIVEQHGGDMYLDTSHTGGTRICFTLPAAPAADPARSAAADRAAEPPGDGAGPAAASPGGTNSSTEGIPA